MAGAMAAGGVGAIAGGRQIYNVECNSVKGVFDLTKANMRGAKCFQCGCSTCMLLPVDQRMVTGNEFERHAGMGSSKKWKTSVKYLPENKSVSFLMK